MTNIDTSSDNVSPTHWDMEQSSDLLVRLASEKNLSQLMNRILTEARNLTGAEGGTFYRIVDEGLDAKLVFSVVQNPALGIESLILEESDSGWAPINLYDNEKPNYKNVASFVAIKGKPVNIEDAYTTDSFDFSGTRQFDKTKGYRSQSFLTIPLLNHEDYVIGVIQLINARVGDSIGVFSNDNQLKLEAMAKFAAITLDNQLLVKSHKDLLDAFIQALAQIIDVRSAHTSAHCQRIPVLTELISQAACEQTEGYFKDFDLNEDEWYELHVAAWMHDCGKLATSESILNKGTKLEHLQDTFDAVVARFSVCAAQQTDPVAIGRLKEDIHFLEKINKGGEFMSDEFKERVNQIARHTWVDILDNEHPLLTEDEVYNLCITRGTINNEERSEINRHIDITIDVLEKLPFPKKLKRVPEYAGGHHERMDGKGYPRGLKRDEMSIPARIMGIADIFEALTAKERPYKPPMPLSQAFSILRSMRDDNHIDPDVFELFLTSGVWKSYANDHMLEKQMDVDDVTPYIN